MTKFTPEDVKRLAERLKQAKGRGHPSHFLIGAGCSISAGIPSAADLVARIHQDYAANCADLSDGHRHLYGACMALLTINERRDLIRPYLDKAKINWGTIALAQMIADGFIGRVLTVNFDMVLERACALLGIQPAVYDFGVAPASDPAMIVSPAIVHLHGQSYGLVLLNTDDETKKHREKLHPILLDTLRAAPLVVTGYSGSADGIFQTLIDEFQGREGLYWVGYKEEAEPHIRPLLAKDHSRFVGGADFDRFMIELAQSLGSWPPKLFADPFGHLIGELEPVVSYPIRDSESEIDLLSDLRQRLEAWREKEISSEPSPTDFANLYMQGRYAELANLFAAKLKNRELSDEEQEIASWSFFTWGNELSKQAKRASGEEAVRLFAEAGEKYQAALAIKPDKLDAINNWGNVLSEQAKRASGEDAARLFADAGEKYRAALAIKPDMHVALTNWGTLLSEQAKRASAEEAVRLVAEAGEKYQAALAIKPDKHEALYNWGVLLSEQAKRDNGEAAAQLFAAAGEKYQAALAIKEDDHEALNNWGVALAEQFKGVSGDEATRLFAKACEKYRAALAVKPDDYEALNNWGVLLLEQAKRTSGDEAVRLLAEAADKIGAAVSINPKETYNLACVCALQANEQGCKDALKSAEEHESLPPIDHLKSDSDLDNVRETPWFKALIELLSSKSA